MAGLADQVAGEGRLVAYEAASYALGVLEGNLVLVADTSPGVGQIAFPDILAEGSPAARHMDQTAGLVEAGSRRRGKETVVGI